ncbi:hypothetical protein QWY31_15730 [Cytophagales bacterium LB-30]|uniref:Bacterial surface antigen (D15) domain-containing protein n=1 Tax=Shiella aurantiaca TaxID=3058365 RepID=A0ABT8F9T3_9BACT|nr:hypothetical protein [Shiella aurantiaca]MDN4166961.1 hypothetical protein [Shiella aurantiaca]
MSKTFLIILSICLAAVCSHPLWAQRDSLVIQFDTLQIKGNSYFMLRDSLWFSNKDTTVIFADTLFRVNRYRRGLKNTEYFYENLESKFQGNRLTRELYDILFTTPKKPSSHSAKPAIAAERYQEFVGSTIDRIIIKRLDVFGPNVTDTLRQAKNWAEKVGNKLHMHTRKHVVRNALLIQPGDKLDPYLLVDTERLLRQLPYIKDARIYVIPKEDNNRAVDILVITKDVFAFSGNFQPNSLSSGEAGIDYINIFGLGHELDSRFFINPELSTPLGYALNYKINNFSNTYIRGEAFMRNSYLNEQMGLRINRRFVTPQIRNAGGIEWSTSKQIFAYQPPGGDLHIQGAAFERKDLWLAHAIEFPFENKSLRDRARWVWAGRVNDTYFFQRPTVSIDSNRQFQQSRQYLGSISLSIRDFYKDQFIYGFGRTEDVPTGYLFQFTTGLEQHDFGERWYLGASFSKAFQDPTWGYFYSSSAYGTFFNPSITEQGVFRQDIKYISPISRGKHYRFRHILKANYTQGFQRFPYEYLSIAGNEGIRGLSGTGMLGTQKLVLQAESFVITPFNYLDFQLIAFLFADIGFIGTKQAPVLSASPYQGFGMGLRLRNDNLAFNIFQLRLAFYPRVPIGTQAYDILVTGETNTRFDEFDTEAPRVLSFQ